MHDRHLNHPQSPGRTAVRTRSAPRTIKTRHSATAVASSTSAGRGGLDITAPTTRSPLHHRPDDLRRPDRDKAAEERGQHCPEQGHGRPGVRPRNLHNVDGPWRRIRWHSERGPDDSTTASLRCHGRRLHPHECHDKHRRQPAQRDPLLPVHQRAIPTWVEEAWRANAPHPRHRSRRRASPPIPTTPQSPSQSWYPPSTQTRAAYPRTSRSGA